MAWEVEFTDEFGSWWTALSEGVQDAVDRGVGVLEAKGPNLEHPHSTKVVTSKHSAMRELRIQHAGEPYRIFYAFDPRRAAILLIGGNKVGDGRFYERMVPQVDKIYDQHLKEIGHGKKVR